jgi:hypothetical protein
MTKKFFGLVTILALMFAPIATSAPAFAANKTDGISWYWIKNPKCGYSSCWQMKVKASSTSCPNGLFVTLKEKDSRGNIVGSPIDSVGSLYMGERAILTFRSYYSGRSTGSVDEFSCY